MRKFIDIVDFGLPAIPEPENLHEVEVTTLHSPWRNDIPTGEKIGESKSAQPIFKSEDDSAIYYSLGDPTLSYIIAQKTTTGWIVLKEMQTRIDHRGQGLGVELLLCVVAQGRVVLDTQLSEDMIAVVEKLVRNKIVTASLANTLTGEMERYYPENDVDPKRSIYDQPVPGISRTPLSDETVKHLTWVLESYSNPRGPTLLEHTRRGPLWSDLPISIKLKY